MFLLKLRARIPGKFNAGDFFEVNGDDENVGPANAASSRGSPAMSRPFSGFSRNGEILCDRERG
jgi:hypothetical protein